MLHTLRTQPLPAPEQPDPHQATLDELASLGLQLARHVQQQALASTEASELTALSAAFERLSRTVRRTVLLCRHLRAQPRPIPHPRARELVRRQAIRAIADELEARPQPEQDALNREFRDRLDHPDTEADFLDTPTEHVIETIRRDLGLVTVNGHPLFKRRTPAEAQALHDQARATPSSRPGMSRLDLIVHAAPPHQPIPTALPPQGHPTPS